MMHLITHRPDPCCLYLDRFLSVSAWSCLCNVHNSACHKCSLVQSVDFSDHTPLQCRHCVPHFQCISCIVRKMQLCLSAETVLSPAQWDLMNTIRCSGETLLTLITDILDFSRIEADKMVLIPAEFHLQAVIEAAMEIAGLHAAQKRLQVHSDTIWLHKQDSAH